MPLTLTLQSTVASIATGFGTLGVGPINVVGTIAPQVVNLNLVSGNNAITIPAGAVGVIVVPPSSSAIALKAKTTSGDAGIAIPEALPWVHFFDTLAALPATLYINAASNTTGQCQVVFF